MHTLKRYEVDEKVFGLLIVKLHRLTVFAEKILDFTQECKLEAKREGIELIKTADLFLVVRYIQEPNNELFKLSCRVAILNGL